MKLPGIYLQKCRPDSSYEDPVHVMSAYWQNNSCSPFGNNSTSCSLGNMASYALNVHKWTDVAAGFKFAKDKNIQITIKKHRARFSGQIGRRRVISSLDA